MRKRCDVPNNIINYCHKLKQCFVWSHKQRSLAYWHLLWQVSCLIKGYTEEQGRIMKDKKINMVQWTNVNRNSRFVNPPPLSWLSEISGAVHLALPGFNFILLAKLVPALNRYPYTIYHVRGLLYWRVILWPCKIMTEILAPVECTNWTLSAYHCSHGWNDVPSAYWSDYWCHLMSQYLLILTWVPLPPPPTHPSPCFAGPKL